MKTKFLLNKKKDWMDYSNKIRNIPYDQSSWWDASKINKTQKQYMIGYVDQMTNNLIGASKVHYISKKDLENRGLYNIFHPNSKVMEVVDMHVNKEYRGEGFCKELIKDCITVANNRKRDLFLAVEGHNEPAKRCYKYNGFRFINATDKLKDFYVKRWNHLNDPMFMYRYRD